MKQALLVCVLAAASCTSQPEASCPAIQTLTYRDAATDARGALARGDRHLLMLGGFVGSLPGVPEPGDHPTQLLDGTSHTATEACRRMAASAEAYAAKYNQTIIAAH